MRLLLASIIIFISCRQTQPKQKIIIQHEFDNEYLLDTTIKFQNIRQVAYGYSFSYPLNFIEVEDTIGQVDSFMLYSPNQKAKIKYFVEGDMARNKDITDETEKNLFKKYFDSFTNGKHILTQNAKIIKTSYTFNPYQYGKAANFMVLGERDTTEFIFKTELSEVPISGNLTFKTFIMEYPKSTKSFYRPMATQMAKDFGQ